MITLRSNRTMAVLAVVLGVMLFAVGVLTGEVLQIVSGTMLGVLGVLLLVNPMLVLTGQEAQVRSPLGFTARRFPVSAPSDIRIEGSKVTHTATGKRIASLGFGIDPGDAARLRAWARGDQTGD
jgi:hypothetical protein